MVIVSPYAKPGFTDSQVATYNSMLAFIEHTFGLAPLTSLDADAYDYSEAFAYSQRPLSGIHLTHHPVPAWEIRWLRSHPGDPDEPS